MPRLATQVHAGQSAEVFNQRRAAWRSDARIQRVEELIRYGMDTAIEDTGRHDWYEPLRTKSKPLSYPRMMLPNSATIGKAENICSI